jgi:predicted dehydrogenase
VGIIGLGGMGTMHFGCYERLHNAEVVAIADVDEEKLAPGETSVQINVGEGGAAIDPGRHRLYTDADDLIADEDVDLVDVCLPTFLHAEHSTRALQAGKHVLCEKPMALTHEECRRVLRAAEGSPGKLMVAHCVRFFPAYEYLKELVGSNRFGRLLQLSLWRGGTPPEWSWDGWLRDHTRSGGMILDLHIHDADFAHYLLGRPRAVCSRGAPGPSGGYDVVETQYFFEDRVAVRAGANMTLPHGFGFEAHFMAAFERGCLRFSTADPHGLMEITDQGRHHPDLPHKDGYQEEIQYFLHCIENDELPAVSMPASSAFSVQLVEAERESVESGQVVAVEG